MTGTYTLLIYLTKWVINLSYNLFEFQALIINAEASNELHATCPPTVNLIENPVVTPFGHTYEKAALLEHMAKHGDVDPTAPTLDLIQVI